jgi:hypothetical protein
MKKFIVLFLMLFSFVFADTGWQSATTLVSNQPANDETNYHGINFIVSSYVDIDGIHVFYDDGTTQSGGGYWKAVTFDIDGTVLHSSNITSDIVYDSHIDGNDDAIFIVWVDSYDISGDEYGRVRAKISTDGGDNWSSTYSHTLTEIVNRVNDLSVDCDDDGIHVLTKGDLNTYGPEYLFLPNDADSDSDWDHDGEAPGGSEYGHVTDCDDNGFAVEAINDYGTSSYDNIFFTYVTDIAWKVRGAISVDNGSNWNEKDYLDESNNFQKMYGMDMAYDGDGNFCCVNVRNGSSIDSLALYWRPAKGSSSYSGTWSTPSYVIDNGWYMLSGLYDVASRNDGYVDLVYPLYGTNKALKYRKISTSSNGSAETINEQLSYYPDVTNHHDIFVIYRSAFKGSTGNIVLQYRDAAPPAVTISKEWAGTSPKITWSAPPYLDVEDYDVWRKYGNGSWTNIATTSNLYYIDGEVYSGGRAKAYYKVKVSDHDNNKSAYSNQITYVGMGIETGANLQDDIMFQPTKFALHSAYPNPFNPSTTITFDIPEDSYLSLSVYNSIGQKVADLVEGNMEVGRHQIQFDGSNLSSGIYFIKMVTAKFNKMEKIVLMK